MGSWWNGITCPSLLSSLLLPSVLVAGTGLELPAISPWVGDLLVSLKDNCILPWIIRSTLFSSKYFRHRDYFLSVPCQLNFMLWPTTCLCLKSTRKLQLCKKTPNPLFNVDLSTNLSWKKLEKFMDIYVKIISGALFYLLSIFFLRKAIMKLSAWTLPKMCWDHLDPRCSSAVCAPPLPSHCSRPSPWGSPAHRVLCRTVTRAYKTCPTVPSI